jgi:hypothetical protein
MASNANVNLCILWEDEVRTAARLLHELHEASGTDDEERESGLASAALVACMTALWGLTDDRAAVILASREIRKRGTTEPQHSEQP